MAVTSLWIRLRAGRWRGASCVVFAAVFFACSQASHPQPDGPNSGSNASQGQAAGTLTLGRGDWPAELQKDLDWQAAAGGDSWSLFRLGERRAQLRQQIEVGGPAAELALRAWPFAKVAWTERGVICRNLPSYAVTDWGPLLVALRESAAVEGEFGEVLDPDAAPSCERTFELLDRQTAAMPEPVFDEYTATCQALGRSSCSSTP